jgi:predicted  nucleic acid-binding Zn ribbon protein
MMEKHLRVERQERVAGQDLNELRQVRCCACGKVLAEVAESIVGTVRIQCRSCKTFNVVYRE